MTNRIRAVWAGALSIMSAALFLSTASPALAETDTPGAGNQPAILSSASVELTETNSKLKTSGRLSISDADSPQRFVAQRNAAGTNGSFSINSAGAWLRQ